MFHLKCKKLKRNVLVLIYDKKETTKTPHRSCVTSQNDEEGGFSPASKRVGFFSIEIHRTQKNVERQMSGGWTDTTNDDEISMEIR